MAKACAKKIMERCILVVNVSNFQYSNGKVKDEMGSKLPFRKSVLSLNLVWIMGRMQRRGISVPLYITSMFTFHNTLRYL